MVKRDKWKINHKNKGYLKIHVATVNVKSKKIRSIKVTDEHSHENKALSELIDNIIKSDIMTAIGKLFAEDGPYDGNEILDVLQTMGSYLVLK